MEVSTAAASLDEIGAASDQRWRVRLGWLDGRTASNRMAPPAPTSPLRLDVWSFAAARACGPPPKLGKFGGRHKD